MSLDTPLFIPSDLRRDRLYEQITDKIREIIATKRLRPGSRLPSERELAKQLGVNRTTVRHALYILQQQGLIEVKPGAGSRLISMTPSVLGEAIERYFLFGDCSHRELLTVRELLEPETAALAAVHATLQDLDRLRARVDEIEASFAAGDFVRCAAADAAFHSELAVAGKNRLLMAFMAGIRQVMNAWLKTQVETMSRESGMHGHRQVYTAVAARDAQRARELMRAHLVLARSYLLDMAGDGEADAERSG